MRRRFAIRMRKEIIALGGVVESEGWLCRPGWKRKDCGYGVTVGYKGWHVNASGYDELEAYRLAVDTMTEDLPERNQMEVL